MVVFIPKKKEMKELVKKINVFFLNFFIYFSGDTMDDINAALKRHKQRCHQDVSKEKKSKISQECRKILISIMFIVGSVIYIKLGENNLANYKKYIFENNLMFTKINNWYTKNFGNILPTVSTPSEVNVSKTDNISAKEKYQDGYKIVDVSGPITSIASGLLVFMGEKENYGNTLIIQGVDGTDIWYGNISDVNLKLYDYVEAGSILGNASENYYYLIFQKEGNYLTYEDYQKSMQA